MALGLECNTVLVLALDKSALESVPQMTVESAKELDFEYHSF